MRADPPTKVLALGVGNPDRGDDAAGPMVVARLKQAMNVGIEARALTGEATELIEAWSGREAVIVIDAVATGGAAPGTIHRWDAAAGPLPVELENRSSHAFGLGHAIELARALGRLPRRMIVYGVEGAGFGLGDAPSEAVQKAVGPLAEAVRREAEEFLKALDAGRGEGSDRDA
jgi:hydrogenase maturation protease